MPERVVIVGQTPPPWHGQAVMIAALLGGDTPRLEKYHVPMRFSRTDSEIGRVRGRKLLHLAQLTRSVARTQRRIGARVLYYPPAGPSLVPALRDAVLLLAVRRRFERTVLHFHASGLAELLASAPRPLSSTLRRAYEGVDRAIVLAEHGRRDAEAIGAQEVRVIPYGIPDAFPQYEPLRAAARSNSDRPVRLLYVGALRESKGVLDLVSAVARLRRQGCAVQLDLVGAFASDAFAARLRGLLRREAGVFESVRLCGSLSGDAKWKRYVEADVFCFPSFYEAESLPVVLLEALQFGLPIITTRWRGIPSIVADGRTGVLLGIRDVEGIVAAIRRFAVTPTLRASMAAAARQAFLDRFTLERYLEGMEEALSFP